jgi:diguanylate cyclase
VNRRTGISAVAVVAGGVALAAGATGLESVDLAIRCMVAIAIAVLALVDRRPIVRLSAVTGAWILLAGAAETAGAPMVVVDLLYLGFYATVGGAMLIASGRIDPRSARLLHLDCLVVAAAAMTIVWAWSVVPARDALETDWVSATLHVAYQPIGAVILALVVRVVTMPGVRSPSLVLIGMAVANGLTADLLLAAHEAGRVAELPTMTGAFVTAAMCCSFAGLVHPSSNRVMSPGMHAPRGDHVVRLGVLVAACVAAPPTTLLVPVSGSVDLWGRIALTTVAGCLLAARVVSSVKAAAAAERDRLDLLVRDQLTGLPNRAGMVEHIARLHDDVPADRPVEPLTVIAVDLVAFRRINDWRGRDLGDQVLVTVAERLCSIAGPDVVARLDHDVFAVLVADHATSLSVASVAASIERAVGEPIPVSHGETIRLQARLGIAEAAADVQGAAEIAAQLLLDADGALHRAKDRGVTVSVHDSGYREEIAERIQLEGRMRTALASGGFEVHYQPIVSLRHGRCAGVEALVRWPLPDGGFVAPDRFIPVAEHCGLVNQLDSFVRRQALTDLARWTTLDPTFVMSINLSVVGWLSEGIVDRVVDDLLAAGVSGDRLCLEITETAEGDVSEARPAIEALRLRSMSVALDDFGTGSSSLRLARLPIDRIKIDRSFTADVLHDPDARALIESVAVLGRRLGRAIVAEGVENEAQARAVAALGVTHAQGWLWEKAVPADEVEAVVARIDARSSAAVTSRSATAIPASPGEPSR